MGFIIHDWKMKRRHWIIIMIITLLEICLIWIRVFNWLINALSRKVWYLVLCHFNWTEISIIWILMFMYNLVQFTLQWSPTNLFFCTYFLSFINLSCCFKAYVKTLVCFNQLFELEVIYAKDQADLSADKSS